MVEAQEGVNANTDLLMIKRVRDTEREKASFTLQTWVIISTSLLQCSAFDWDAETYKGT